jgi:alkylhydroperoxidase/carboxymuconolactone decarboxylase family protein YurZ
MARPSRVRAQSPEEWSESTRAEFANVQVVARPPAEPAAGDPEAAPRPLHLPSVIANHPTFLPPYLAWAKAVALSGVLDYRTNALLALRTAIRCQSEFEWGVHAETAMTRGGLSPEEVARVAVGPDAPGWSAGDAALLRAADELHDTHTISDTTWAELTADHDDAAMLEIAFVVGHYTMLSMVANTAGVPPEPRWLPLP